MKDLLKTVLATSALIAIAGAASAEDTAFEVKFSFDRNAPVGVTYERFMETATESCQIQYPLSTTGYSREAMKRFRRKCELMLIDQVVNVIDNPSMTMLHQSITGQSPSRTLTAKTKPASKP